MRQPDDDATAAWTRMTFDRGRPEVGEAATMEAPPPLVDPFGRAITYLRVSVTDRCDLRCRYCMDHRTVFVPKRDVLSFEEMDRICGVFIRGGVRKLRITGGEPLVRRDVMTLFRALSRYRDDGALDELTLTTNGIHLARHARALAGHGVRRVNVSLDSLDPDTFRAISRGGDVDAVIAGIGSARAAGLAVKINTVALKGTNEAQLSDLLAWCGDNGLDMTLIEVMPMGIVDGVHRGDQFLPLSAVRRRLAERWTLVDVADRTGGPARYVRVVETGRRLGFITPLTNTFCDGCNRVRLTCTGRLYPCLGQAGSTDLRAVIRAGGDDHALDRAIRAAITRKPKGHDFIADAGGVDAAPAVERQMHVTGG